MVMLLDIAGLPSARGAYSMRKLRSAYAGSAIRVRRLSDSGEADIGFSGEDLDETALTTHVGAGDNGYIVTWYDQTGNGNDQTQATASRQLNIVLTGSVNHNALGKPKALSLDATLRGYAQGTSWTGAYTGFTCSAAAVFAMGSTANDRILSIAANNTAADYNSTNGAVLLQRNVSTNALMAFRNSAALGNVAATVGSIYAAGCRFDGDDAQGGTFGNRVELSDATSNDAANSAAFSATAIYMGCFQGAGNPSIGSGGERYEGVVWTDLLSDAQMAAVLANQEAYWITGVSVPTETLVPSGDVSLVNATFTGGAGNAWQSVDEGIAGADNTFVSPTDTSQAMTAWFSFPPLTAGRTVLAGADLCTLKLWVDKLPGTNTTTVTATIHESGNATVLATPINAVSVTNATGEEVSGTFNGNVLADNTGANAEVKVVTAPGAP